MKTKLLLLCTAGLLVALVRAPAATLYVDAASTNAVPPFTNWITAAANIQDAVDSAAPSDTVLVTNGVYQIGARAIYGMSNRVAVTKPLTVRSVNGPPVTSIVGAGPNGPTAIRCVYLTNDAVLSGFTLTNGATQDSGDLYTNASGGGVWCESASVVVSNCVLTGNSASFAGGGSYYGTLNNCVLKGNSAMYGGGANASMLTDCTLTGNYVELLGGGGGGANASILTNCTLASNFAHDAGGGASDSRLTDCTLTDNSTYDSGGGAYGSTLYSCTLSGNSSDYHGGGAHGSTLTNCMLTGNSAEETGGGAYGSTLNSCTLTGNCADYGSGAMWATLDNCTVTGNSAREGGGGVFNSTLNDCILYYNTASSFGANYSFDSAVNYSCTTPDLGTGVGNITNEPAFVDFAGGNLRLQSNSPCINAGNNAYVTAATDLDGNPRVVGGTVDIGAYEWQGPIRYVSAASTNPIAPYSSWASAAVTIQDAVDAAVDGDEVVVTNGVYQTGARDVYGMSNRVAVTKPVTVRSVNGPGITSIVGSGPLGVTALRCVYLTNGAVLVGFTLTNGGTQTVDDWEVISITNSGGGVWCESQSVVVTNCVLVGNSAGAGGGAFGGTLNNCVLTGNSAWDSAGGGGAYASTLNNCMVTGNLAGWGGGGAEWSTLNNCMVTGNSGGGEGGGGAAGGTLNNCTLTGNTASYGGGAVASTLNNCMVTGNWVRGEFASGGGVDGGTLNNCTLTGNSADYGGGAFYCTLNNCTVTGNSAWYSGGGVIRGTLNNCTLTGNSAGDSGGAFASTLNNCIVYFNFADHAPNWGQNEFYSIALNYSCTTPDPESGGGNITNAPLFVDTNGWSNLRLQSNSPCINAGNNAYVTAATDLDGLPRIAGGTVDIGAYEFQSPASTISYAWLQQSGLPTDGSADYVDTDHDGHNNWQEWMAGTDPTNALSVLWLASPMITPTNVTLTWTSVTNRTYALEQATNLGGAPAFSVLASNLAGLPGTTSWTDTNAPVSGPRFYQLRVSP